MEWANATTRRYDNYLSFCYLLRLISAVSSYLILYQIKQCQCEYNVGYTCSLPYFFGTSNLCRPPNRMQSGDTVCMHQSLPNVTLCPEVKELPGRRQFTDSNQWDRPKSNRARLNTKPPFKDKTTVRAIIFYIWAPYTGKKKRYLYVEMLPRPLITNRNYRQVSNIRRTLVGNKIVDHSDVVGASPVGAAPTTSSFSTKHLASTGWVKTTTRWDEKHLNFEIWCVLY